MINIHGISAFKDNYIWCIYDNEHKDAIVIDPGSYQEVDTFLDTYQLKLKAILITHHHPDHVGGVKKLKQKYNCQIIASSQSKLDFVDQALNDKDEIELLGQKFTSMDVPGHTLDHNAYYCENIEAIFCGDTLFSAGCGRLFEGSAQQILHSLNKIKNLPASTKIYCAHEYTLANLEFASSLMPNNKELKHYFTETKKLRNKGVPSIPSILATEIHINPFLRSNDQELIQSIQQMFPEIDKDELSIFTATRQAKDAY